ncbi:MAG: MogA/MoaB family molybdenum cofactor biosynthesis protein [Atopobiaceae bacterium]|nr:MogA/MoaB family molybdenum cofactor biosynthesis protein [Atopobiaceae bacterium]
MSESSYDATSFSARVITVSDRSSRGERSDASGPALIAFLGEKGFTVDTHAEVVPDERQQIARALHKAISDDIALVVTTGGTGFSPRDITPEVTSEVCERMVPGIPERMRASSLLITPKACLSREVAGIVQRTLIINLPGSPKAAIENIAAVMDVLPHGLGILRGTILDG